MFPAIGFSLVEVLISLSIFSVSTLGLFKHQWQHNKSFQAYQIQQYALDLIDDASEIVAAGFEIPPKLVSELEAKVHGRFQLQNINKGQTISIFFSSYDKGVLKSHLVTRTL